ncbi:MAG TPA: protein kinase [Candidatus Sulfotelmatobacter sp.]|jgi:serine/threonine protein kinase
MPLPSGTRLGPYEIVAPAGAGGMGEVYRARDSRLNRDVAIKVLPTAFARDSDRLRRFQQEAQAVAALNHPNILAIHDFGEHDGSPYIVTEFLEGETLRVRVDGGALAPRKATELAEQISRGLAAAHDKGIVHRDLKPENIFITRDGRAKILDFGLAKLTRPEITSDAATLPSQTEPGSVMGTVGYMSPEQVKGHVADHRTDLFSFGAILYEMLTGKRAFQKTTSAETMTAILKDDPPALSSQTSSSQHLIAPLLQQVVDHCLEKDPEHRFQSASDLSFALRAVHDSSSSAVTTLTPSKQKRWLRWIAMAAAALAVGSMLTFFLVHRDDQNSKPSIQAAIMPPPGDGFWANLNQPAVISPDGKFLALIAMRDGRTQLWLRRLDSADAQPIAGSEDASYPFWSPDSRYIGFFTVSKLKKLDIAAGALTDICTADSFRMGGSWSSQGVIVFATLSGALKKVSANGGTPEPIPGVQLANDAIGQLWPTFLPDGEHFLYLEWRYATPEEHTNSVWMGSLRGEKPRRIPLDSSNVQYAAGYLLFSRGGDLLAQKFDPGRGDLAGSAVPIVRNIQYDRFVQAGAFSSSENGILVYAPAGTGSNTELTWIDRSGKVVGTLGDAQEYLTPAISPNGKWVAVGIKPTNARERIWIFDADRGTKFPLEKQETGPTSYAPVWSPDGKQLAYRQAVGKDTLIEVQPSDGSGDEKQLGTPSSELVEVLDWSPDNRYLLTGRTKFAGLDTWHDYLQVAKIDEPEKSVLDIDDAGSARFSPDGHWLAYSDDTTGQLYVTPFPGPGAKIAVTSEGGSEARWRSDGQELFFASDDLTITSVQVHESASEFRVLSSHPLFRMPVSVNEKNYDVTRDGQRFLVTYRTHREQSAPLAVMTNWSAGLQNQPKN